jgi:hypothetical protein
MKTIRFLLCVAAIILLPAVNAHANVYATDIKVNGSLHTVTNSGSSPVAISYRLNENATMGVKVAIWQGTTNVATLTGGTNLGLNTVTWGVTNASGVTLSNGSFSITITAAASGYTNWQQISVDTNAGNYAFFPQGLAVNNNTNSPYYGRILVGNAFANGTATNPVNGQLIQDGIYKLNADGSYADEGGFGYGGYTMDDAGGTATNEMSPLYAACPFMLRVGGDDRVYMLDYSGVGAIIAFDMEVTTNQVVIDDGGAKGGVLGGPHTYSGNPLFTDIVYGFGEFDVTSTETTNAAVWLCDNDYPNWGIWMYHMTNGASNTNDNGTQAVIAGSTSDLSLVSSGGCTVDTNLDIFCGQYRTHENALYQGMEFTNWNGGVLPPTNGGANGPFFYAFGTTPGEVNWGYGCGVDVTCGTDPSFEGVMDTVVNSRKNPTLVAFPMGAGDLNGFVTYTTNVTILDLSTNDGVVTTNYTTNVSSAGSGGGIRVLNATNGSPDITNGMYTESLTNVDWGSAYDSAAWDHVGNLYGASPSLNLWRAWSPPGANTNTTTAVAKVVIGAATPPGFTITGVAAVPTTTGCAAITISFTGMAVLPVSDKYEVVSSPTLNGTYSAVSDAVITGSGAYFATFTNCETSFYKIDLISN